MNHETAVSRLDRLLDCTLAAEERDALVIHLAECPTCREQLATMARLRGVIRTRLAAVALPPPDLAARVVAHVAEHARGAGPVPATMPAATRRAATAAGWGWRPRRPLLGLGLAGAVGAAVLVLAIGGWWLRTVMPGAPGVDVTDQLVAQHRLFAHDETLLEVRGDTDAMTAWFGDKLAFPVVPPRIPGFELAGGRLLAIESLLAAQLVYDTGESERYVSLIVAPESASPPPGLRSVGRYSVGQRGDVAVVTWVTAGQRVTLVSQLSETDLVGLADRLTALRP